MCQRCCGESAEWMEGCRQLLLPLLDIVLWRNFHQSILGELKQLTGNHNALVTRKVCKKFPRPRAKPLQAVHVQWHHHQSVALCTKPAAKIIQGPWAKLSVHTEYMASLTEGLGVKTWQVSFWNHPRVPSTQSCVCPPFSLSVLGQVLMLAVCTGSSGTGSNPPNW